MFWPIARFELTKRSRMISSYVYFLVLFGFGFLMMIASGGAFSSVSVANGPDKVFANAPHAIQNGLNVLSLFGIMIIASVFGQAVYQDYENRTEALFFTAPIREKAYLAGRFFGTFIFAIILFAAIALGLWFGTHMWFCDHSRFGPNHFATYAWPYVTIIIPNLLITGAIFFTLATLSRRITPVYVGSVILVIGYFIGVNLLHKLENKPLAAIVDAFGLRASALASEYWTISEQNTLRLPLTRLLLLNRLLWVTVGCLLLGYTFFKFKFAHTGVTDNRSASVDVTLSPPTIALAPVTIRPPSGLRLYLRASWLAFTETVKNVYFGVIVFAGVIFMVVSAWSGLDAVYGTSTYPVTYAVLDITSGTFGIITLIIITLYSGDLVFRDRDARMDQILDALPTPTWLPFLANLTALVLVQVVLQFVVLFCSVGIQTAKGYHHYELSIYIKELFGMQLVHIVLTCVLAMTIQTIVNNKYIGFFAMIVYFAFTMFMGTLGLEHHLYRYNSAPEYDYSDMNHFGHFLRPVFWFDLYWSVFAVLLAIVAYLFWPRGLETPFRQRLRIARQRWNGKLAVAVTVFAISFAGLGGYIYYNTNILNKYETSKDRERDSADYEKIYKHLEKEPQPRITEVKVAFDIFPEQPGLVTRGTYTLVNKSGRAVNAIYVTIPGDYIVRKFTVGGAAASHEDKRFHVYTFSHPMQANDSTTFEYELAMGQRGFRNEEQSMEAMANGTFFSSDHLPFIGYEAKAELSEDGKRKKYGLQPKPAMADVNDLEARKNTYISSDSDWVTFEATVSTAPDQIAIAPGYLQKEWLENGRRYFTYKMDAPILDFFSVLSARYQVKRDHWNDVALEIYYNPGHEYDLDQMMKGMKAALTYYTTAFGPYQHRQVRIIEFPRYERFAQSFPNTIPFSESIGFIAKVNPKDPEDIDYPFYVTAHEVAHQWWAHQVIGGNVQGSTMLSETLAQYSALMVMKHEFGADKMHRFLKYELNSYLLGRATERKKEQPLARVENQPYVHYRKGSLIMYALQDYIGEEVLNKALAAYVARVKFQQPPYTNTTELIAELRKVTPPDMQYLIDDFFEHITLYDNRALSATATKRSDGKYDVDVKVTAKKLQADALGVEKEAPMNDWVDVGAVNEAGEPIFTERRRIAAGASDIKFVVATMPAKAGIDPSNKLIDRKPDDNLIRVTQ